MKLYDEIFSNVSIEILDFDRKRVKRDFQLLHWIEALQIIALLIYFYLVRTQNPNQTFFLMCFLLIFLGTLFLRRYIHTCYTSILENECDTKHAISISAALLENGYRRHWSQNVYFLAASLYYDGRFDDVKTIANLMEPYVRSDMDRMRRYFLYAKLAHHYRDLDTLYEYIQAMKNLALTMHLYGKWQHLYLEIIEYWDLLSLEMKHKYKKLYQCYQSSEAYIDTVLNEVKKNYHLAMIAKSMNDQALAKKHRAIVLEKGGTLWYKQHCLIDE